MAISPPATHLFARLDPRAASGPDRSLKVLWQAGFDDATRASWERLLAVDTTSSPFVSPGWVDAWIRHCGEGATLALVTVWSAGELMGVAPFMEVTVRGTRVLTGAARRDSDHWDVVARPDVREAVVRAVVGEIRRRRDRWDVVRLDHLPPDSTIESELRRSGLRVTTVASTPCPVVALPGSFEEYLMSVPKKRRQSIRRSLKRLDAGDVGIRPVTDRSDLERTLVTWQALRVEQYRSRRAKINQIHVTESYREFLVAALSDMTQTGAASVWSVEHEGRVVGVYITLSDSRAAYAYQGGYDIAVSTLGIGKIVNALILKTGSADGKAALDFGRGAEPYKYWYGAQDHDTVALMCGHAGARSTLAYTWSAISLKTHAAVGKRRRRTEAPGTED
jgi:CelD/BcsL family acetyltransferase involved in cellulose biosynthesis